MDKLRRAELSARGVPVRSALCEHFPFTRQELYDLARVRGYTSFRELLAAHGTGRGCEICRPVVASILASRTGGYVLDGEQESLQDTNDHMLANIQRDGTCSVVPRVPGGEITPEKLAVLADVADNYECEWRRTLTDPDALRHLVSFVNPPARPVTGSRCAVSPTWCQTVG